MRCPTCGTESQEGKRFCADCGAALSLAASGGIPLGTTSQVSESTRRLKGERRHLTILFCDLVNSTRLAAERDPEEWQGIVAEYRRAAGQAILRSGGYVARYLGDGLLVFFGWPTANEDDGERAVRAGLAIVEAMEALNLRLAGEKGVELLVRIGIDSGSVVVGDSGSGEVDVFGDAPNIASRVQGVSPPNAVLITSAAHNLVKGRFEVEDCGVHRLAGIERPVQLYRAVRPSGVRRSWRHGAGHRPTPFVGREAELNLLRSSWSNVCKGAGQFVFVTGEPGIGKSRLVEEFHSRIKDEKHLWIDSAGERFFESTPFHVVTDMLERSFGWRGDESKQERVAQMERALQLVGVKLEEVIPLIAGVFDLPVPQKYPPLIFSADQRRARLLTALVGCVFGATRLQPLVIAIEDLHWVDPSTIELMQLLVEQAATVPLMLIGTSRPEFIAPWPMQAHHAKITLNRFNDHQTREMVAGVATRARLLSHVVDVVVKRSDGVPLFAEELARLLLEGEGRSETREIPATLHDSLRARLDRLGRAKEIAQFASVVGREFSYELLRAVSPMSDEELRSGLAGLADAQLIYVRGLPPQANYRFKHALIQDAAYEALLKSRRRELHAGVARTITQRFVALAEAQPEVIALHWTQAGEAEPAVAAWKNAANVAYARRAFKEAETAYRQALAMLTTLSESPERDAKELDLCSGLNRVLQLTQGYAAPETVEAAARARFLAEKSGSLSQLVREEAKIWRAVITAGDYAGAIALADRILDLSHSDGDHPARLVFALNAQMQTRFYTGDLQAVEEHYERLSPLIDTVGEKQAPGNNIVAIGIASLTAWVLGRSDRARQRMVRAVGFARKSKNPYDLAMALHFLANLHASAERDPDRTEKTAAQLLTLSEKNGFSYAASLALGPLGWARSQKGAGRESAASMRQALADQVASGARVSICLTLNRLAEVEALTAPSKALKTIEEALTANPQERIYRPQSLTIRGTLKHRLGEGASAEADFREAMSLAQAMGAKAFELRAATALARLLQTRRDPVAARSVLAPVYGWFTEGHYLSDLKDARALLDQLGE
jgi:class 3 adenylate cyclase/tetratricopeptide (TPR) repeat protein